MTMMPLPAVYSVLLPGLGQLYQHRARRAVLIFGLFIGMSYFAPTQGWLPLAALTAGVDSLRIQASVNRVAEGSRIRRYLFVSVGLVAFLSWFGLAAGRWIL